MKQLICVKSLYYNEWFGEYELICNKKYVDQTSIFAIITTDEEYVVINELGVNKIYSSEFLQEISQNRKDKLQKLNK